MTIFQSVLVLMLAGQIGVPIALPPLPEDPMMARVAPRECVWYVSWSGTSGLDPKSTNPAEQLLAEPELREFVHGVGKALAGAIRKGAPPSPVGQLLGAEGPGLIHALLTHPTAAFISNAGVGPFGLDIAGGIVVGTGDETENLKATLERLDQMLPAPPQPASAIHTIDAAPTEAAAGWHKFPSLPPSPIVEWGFRGKYLIVGIGEGSADAILARTKGEPPEWLRAIRKKLPVERVSTVHYVNVKRIVAAIRPFVGTPGPWRELGPELQALSNIRAFACVSGLDGTGCVSKSWVHADDPASPLLGLIGARPLTAADLAPIPKDASLAIAVRVQPNFLWTLILAEARNVDAAEDARLGEAALRITADGVRGMTPAESKQLAEQVKEFSTSRRRLEQQLKENEFEPQLGFRVQKDLLQTLGDSCCIYNSPGEGGSFFTGLTVVVPVKDHDRLAKSNDALVKRVRDATAVGPDRQPRFGLTDIAFAKHRIFCLKYLGDGMPLVLSWCITDKHLILALSPQNIRAFLARDPAAPTLADLPAVAQKLKAASPVLLTYQDTRELLKSGYPFLQLFAATKCAQLQRDGVDLDASLLPSLPSLTRHAEPGFGEVSRERDGLVYVSRQSVPVDMALSGLLPAWNSWFVFSSDEPATQPSMFGNQSQIFSFSIGLTR